MIHEAAGANFYRHILVAYIANIIEFEGYTFLEHEFNSAPLAALEPEEKKALLKAAEDAQRLLEPKEASE